MRPGCSAASVPNCSATISGAWLGSMMPPAPMPDAAGAGRDMRQRHRGGGAGDAGHVVVLRHPVAPVAQRLRMAREVGRIAQRLPGVAAFGDGGKVEDGERDHAGRYGHGPVAMKPLPEAARPAQPALVAIT